MHEQDFEKSVQKSMEELSFLPSAPVWEAVSAAIEKKKKRRVLIWLLPFACGFLGLSGLLFFTMNDNKHLNNLKETNKNIETENKLAVPSELNVENAPADIAINQSAPQKSNTRKDSLSNTVYSQIFKNAALNYRNNVGRKKLALLQKAQTEFAEITPSTLQDSIYENGQSSISLIEKREVLPLPLLASERKNIYDRNTYLKPLPRIDAPFIIKKKPKPSPYAFVFSIQYGIAGLTQKSIFNSDKSALYYAMENRPGMSGGNAATFYPSAPQNGRFFSAGLHINYPLYRRLFISGGLAYLQYTQRSSVGTQVQRGSLPANTSADALTNGASFYSSSVQSGLSIQSSFVNRYHFASVPLALHYKPLKKLPLHVHAGVKLNYLFSARSLQYDTASKVFYQSNASLQKLQTALTAGINYKVAAGRRWQLVAGPHIAYHLSAARRNAFFNNGHLFQYSFGLHLHQKK